MASTPHRPDSSPRFQAFTAACAFFGMVALVICALWLGGLLLFASGCAFAPYPDREGGVMGVGVGSGFPITPEAVADAAPAVGTAVGTAIGGPAGGAIGGLVGQGVTALIGVLGAADSVRQRKRRGQAEAAKAKLQGESDGWDQAEDYRLKQVGIVATTASPVAAVAPLAPLAPIAPIAPIAPLAPISHAPPAGSGGRA